MNIREMLEMEEKLYLSPYAARSAQTRGRERFADPCDIRTEYQRDRDRIIHCKAFRRLKHKTQVFLAPAGDHYRTRLTHTLEVAQIARTVAKALRLNQDLTEAIALGHDLGHTPFGHAGEDALDGICTEGFTHYEQSVRVVEVLEKKGMGLNLTWEVRDGILNHRTAGNPSTLEGKIVRLSDKIAYINHDIDDAIRGGILTEEMLPKSCTDILGHTVKARLNCLVHDIIEHSLDQPDIRMSADIEQAMGNLRKFMFANVYTNSKSKSEDGRAKELLKQLFIYYMNHLDELPEEYRMLREMHGDSDERVVCDYIAGMSDGYAIDTYERLFVPRNWQVY